MKRFKYYKTNDRLLFQDNQKDKLTAITDNGIIRFKENCPIKSNRLFQELSWREQDIILNEIEYQDIYSIGNESNTEFLCDVFESEFMLLDELGIITDREFGADGYSDHYVLEHDYKTVLKHSINKFLNS